MHHDFINVLEKTPVIAAVKDAEGLEKALRTESAVIFILFGDVMNISGLVRKVKDAGKMAMVHIDLITGLSGKEISVDFLHTEAGADGILSTHAALIKHARALGMYTVLRIFMLDSMAFNNVRHQCEQAHPDCIEILPGAMPKVTARVNDMCRTPLIVGGLILDKDDIYQALNAGAISVSTTNAALWEV